MKKYYSRLLFILTLFCFVSFTADEDIIPSPPSPPRLVNDFAGILSPDQVSALENKLVRFSKETSNQIAVVTVNSLGDYDISDFSFKLGRKWGIGKEDRRNGILILIKPKTATEKGKAFIATGKGLEGAIPDATCHEIVYNEMIPKFKQNEYYEGIDAATTVLMSLAKGEYNFADYSKKKNNENVIAIIIVVVIIIIMIIIRRKRKGYTINGHGYNTPWFPFFGGGFFGGGGSGGSSGSSDSGFGGFGGGDFGGGGAGGEW